MAKAELRKISTKITKTIALNTVFNPYCDVERDLSKIFFDRKSGKGRRAKHEPSQNMRAVDRIFSFSR